MKAKGGTMASNTPDEPQLDAAAASQMLESVFEAAGVEPNDVPMEALASYTTYRKERFGLQRAIVATVLVLFLLLPLLFIAPAFSVNERELGERGLPVYSVQVDGVIPIRSVTARLGTHALPVYEEDATAEEERGTAFQFAGQMFQNTDIRVIRTQTVDEDTTVYYICEVYEKQILFSNRIMVTMTHNTVTHATMTQYKVVGYGTTAQPVYPIDELLYSCRYDLEAASAQETAETDLEQLSLYYGYIASRTEDNTIYCAPALWVGRADGSGLLVNRYTDEIMDLP